MTALLLNAAMLALPLAGAVSIALRFTPRRILNAATRYLIWWITFAATLALPLLFVQPQSNVPARAASTPDAVRVQVIEIAASPSATPAVPFHLPLRIPASTARYFILLWAVWSSLLLLRLLFSLRAVCRARLGAIEWKSVAAPRPARVLLADVAAPFASGPIRPSILLPSRLIDELSAQDLDRIVLHEAAHLARRDDCAILAERLMITLFPWNLAARWVARQIDLEREIACDDFVVDATGSATGYADCLTRVVELCGGVRPSYAAAAMASGRAHLSRRVASLLEGNRNSRPSPRMLRVAPFAVGMALLLLFAIRTPRLVALAAPPAPVAQQPASAATANVDVNAAADPDPAPPPAPLPAPLQTSAPQRQPQPTPAPSWEGKRLLVLFLDLPSFAPDDFDRALSASGKLVDTQLRDNNLLAVMTVENGRVLVRQDFTGDHNELHTVLVRIASEARPSTSEWPSTVDSLPSLQLAVRMLSPIKEKKALIYISSGSQRGSSDIALQSLINDAIRANVSFYPIDARGLVK